MHGFSAGAAKLRRNGRSRCTLSIPLQQQKVYDRLAFPAAAFICARLGKRPRWGQLSAGRVLLCSPSPHTTCLGLIPSPEPLPEIALTSSAGREAAPLCPGRSACCISFRFSRVSVCVQKATLLGALGIHPESYLGPKSQIHPPCLLHVRTFTKISPI